MVAESTAPLDPRRDAGELRTKRDVFARFSQATSARLLGVFVGIAILGRLLVGRSPGLGDLAALGVTIAATGSVEWFIHRHLLHAPEGSFRMRVFGTGRGHREHHLRPVDIGWIMLSPSDVIAFAVGFVPFTAAWTGLVSLVPGIAFWPTFTSGLVFVGLGLLHYEWTHLLVHSSYRPTTTYYANLARNHRLHHFRNEGYWLGVTSNSGDRILKTLPDRGDVELSDTARTLG